MEGPLKELKGKTPPPFTSRDLTREAMPRFFQESLTIGERQLKALREINEILESDTLEGLIEEGKITLGIIKPDVHIGGKFLPESDEEAAKFLIKEIGEENVLFSFSTRLAPHQIDDFYADVKAKYSNVIQSGEKTIWQGLSEMLENGPVTFLLLYKNEGNAILWWREKMGATHPAQAEAKSIRGKYGIEENMPNNLTHGSDSVESVRKEVSVLKKIIGEVSAQATERALAFPSETLMKSLGVLENEDELVLVDRIFDSGMRDESWVYGYKLLYFDKNNIQKEVFILEKNFISMGGLNGEKAKSEYKRAKELEKIGIPTVKVYGVDKATVYKDFVLNNGFQEVLDELSNAKDLSDKQKAYLDQLVNIAARLDSEGYSTLNFIGDLVFDKNIESFLYVDFGYDLGEKNKTAKPAALFSLQGRLKRHGNYIQDKYEEMRKSLS